MGKFSQLIRAYLAFRTKLQPKGAVGRWHALVAAIIAGNSGRKENKQAVQNWEKLVGKLLSQFMFSDALNPNQYAAAKKTKKKKPRNSGAIERWMQLTAALLEPDEAGGRGGTGQRETNNKPGRGFQSNGWERLICALIMKNNMQFHVGTIAIVRQMQDQADQ